MHFHMNHYQHLLNRELDELYASMAMRSFALSIVGIFVPLYLLEIGLSVQGVITFFLIFAVTRAAFSVPSAGLAARYGLKKMMLASTVMMALYYFLLRFATGFDVNFLAVLSGIALTIFWTSYHIDFIKCSKKR